MQIDELWHQWHKYTAEIKKLLQTRSPLDAEVRRVVDERAAVAEQIRAKLEVSTNGRA